MLDTPHAKSMLDTPVAKRMPREIAPGVFWIGDCLAQRHKGKVYHGYNAAFLVAGETASCLVETGHPKDFPVIERHMNELFARGLPPLKYLFVTHQETPHCGGLGRVLKTFPDALLYGDVSDYHLAFPQYEHRMRSMKEGDEIDLGGRSLMAVEPVIRDLRTTWWGFDTKERVLFPGDGFAYSHYHEDGHCGLTAEEAFHAAKAKEPEIRYKSIIERYASLNGIPVQLAHAVITVESNYKPNSRGKAGEVGLMQIKPATAKMMGYSGSVTGLFDPETNIRYGMKYLGKAQRLGDGTTCGTILKYNAGHGAKRMNPVSRDYCKKVTRHILEAIGWAIPDRKYEHGV